MDLHVFLNSLVSIGHCMSISRLGNTEDFVPENLLKKCVNKDLRFLDDITDALHQSRLDQHVFLSLFARPSIRSTVLIFSISSSWMVIRSLNHSSDASNLFNHFSISLRARRL